MQRGIALRIAGIMCIGVATAFVLLRTTPEYVNVTSEDGRLTVTGYAREGDMTVTQGFADAGDEWTVTSGAVDDTLPVELRFERPSGPAWDGTEDFDVLRYNDVLAMWERQDVTTVDGYAVLFTTHLGRFALSPVTDVAAPDFLTAYDALRKSAPENAVGYRIAVGATVGDGPLVRLDGVGQQGGCGGAVLPGSDTVYASSTRTANVLVNDVQTTVTFTFLASWYVIPNGSCPEGQSFLASSEYGILPASR